MELFAMLVVVVGSVLSLLARPAEANYPKSDELTLRNQLLADVYFLKEGVDKLLLSSEIAGKRFTNQMDILKTVQNKLQNDNFDSQEVEANCEKITGMFNATLKRQNIFETRLIGKLEEIQEDQMTRFEELLIKLRLNKNCATQTTSLSTLTLLSTTLSEMSEKIDLFGEQFMKFQLMEEQFNAQQTKFDQFAKNQGKLLQQINDKLAKNQEQFDKINWNLANLKDMNGDLKKTLKHPHSKLPMEVILGLTSANITSFK